ncbi:hypothetical protein NFI96_010311 [Prochilodus magdalenae]|nr:hypothetical protein NFI96_010311 [Prochilodus magdalenae]
MEPQSMEPLGSAPFKVLWSARDTFFDAVVASTISCGVGCWGSRLSNADRKRLDRVIKKSSSVLGCPLHPVEVVGDRRMRTKLKHMRKNLSHPMDHSLEALGSSVSARLLHPRCVEESCRPVLRSLVPADYAIDDAGCSRRSQLTWVSVTTSTMVRYLDPTEVAQVVQLLKDGTSICTIATRFAVSPSTVLRVRWRFQEFQAVTLGELDKAVEDESRFYLSTCDRRDRLWRRRGECYAACNIIQHDRFGGGSVMVWGGISLKGRTDLYRLDNGTLTAIRYQDEILGPVVRPCAGAVGPGFLLVHNNARPHVARVCRQFLENEGIDTIDWPTGSPDLSPIEHLWDIMFQSIRRHQVALQTVQELSNALVQIWEGIPQDTIRPRSFLNSYTSFQTHSVEVSSRSGRMDVDASRSEARAALVGALSAAYVTVYQGVVPCLYKIYSIAQLLEKISASVV